MSKLAIILFLLNIIIVCVRFYESYKKERQFFISFINFSSTKIGVASINSVVILFLYNLCDIGILVFFGTLRPFEIERIKERIWFAITDTFLAFAVFSGDLSTNMLLSLSFLLFIKYFHFAFEVRIGSIERDINIPKIIIIKNTLFFTIFTLLDIFYIYYSYQYGDNSDSLQQLMISEYAILCVNLSYNMAKLQIHYIDYIKNYTFYLKVSLFSYLYITKCLLESLIYIFFLCSTLLNHGVLPVLFIRPMLSSMSSFVNSVKTQINCNRVVAYINEICPNTTEQELRNAHDTTCVVCREEMTECKKLPCGHMFHIQCLKAWFQRQQTCPTCRLDILSMINHRTPTSPPPTNPVRNNQNELINTLYDESFQECQCPKCLILTQNINSGNNHIIDPDLFLKYKSIDNQNNTINKELIKNIKLNLEAAKYQIEYLENIINQQNIQIS